MHLSLHAKLNDLIKIRVAAVSYLNTKPLLYGINHHPVREEIDLVEDYPAKIAGMLINDEVDLGLIPVAAVRGLKEWHIVGDYGIGSSGPVASVCIFSEVPIEEIRTVYLDYQSRTSVNLAKVLLKEYWKRDVDVIITKDEDYRNQIKGTTAGVVIGDRALQQRTQNTYIYDLASAWKDHTGLPFVFAAWISNKILPSKFIDSFNSANKLGVQNIDKVIKEHRFEYYSLEEYYTKNIDYVLSNEAKKGLALFLEKLEQL